jgi:hypothetical protein
VIVVQPELDKLDAIRSRVSVSYEEAKEALDRAGGDVVAALIDLENRGRDVLAIATELLDDVQNLLDSGTPKKIRLKLGNRLVKEYPVAFGMAAAFAVGLLAVLVSKASVEIERYGEDLERAHEES